MAVCSSLVARGKGHKFGMLGSVSFGRNESGHCWLEDGRYEVTETSPS